MFELNINLRKTVCNTNLGMNKQKIDTKYCFRKNELIKKRRALCTPYIRPHGVT
jgi:hypothetical protein